MLTGGFLGQLEVELTYADSMLGRLNFRAAVSSSSELLSQNMK